MSNKNPRPPEVVLRKPKTALGILLLSKSVLEALTTNKAMFPSPNPPLASFSSDITTLDTAQTATQARTKGTVAARNTALATVEGDLAHLAAYVQTVVDATPGNAAEIASAAGLSLRKSTAHTKPDLSAKPDPKESGAIEVAAKVGGVRSSHDWQYSTDGGKTWTSVSSTLAAKTTITGLTPATTVSVRHRAVTKTGPDPWSQPLTVVVV